MRTAERSLLAGLGGLSVGSVTLLAVETVSAREFVQPYLVWNLMLAWIPLVLAYLIYRGTDDGHWSRWDRLGLTALWLLFLPNSFYLISDFIHLPEFTSDQLLLAAVTTVAFACTGILLGIVSVYLIHQRLIERLGERLGLSLVGGTLLVTSVAIYIGRDLRWNSWDVLTTPFGLLFDLSERLLHPAQYPQVLLAVGPFFALLSALYFCAWHMVRAIRAAER